MNDISKLEDIQLQSGIPAFDPDIIEKVKAIFEENYITEPQWMIWNETMFRAHLELNGDSKEYIDNLCEEINAGKHGEIVFNQPIPIEGK